MNNTVCKIVYGLSILLIASASIKAAEIELLPGEKVWGGKIKDGSLMPFAEGFTTDLRNNDSNQTNPLLLTNKGRYVWSDQPFSFRIEADRIVILDAVGKVETVKAGSTLREAFVAASKAHFPSDSKTPPSEFFELPQYNTWIELMYDQNQKGVIEYAKGILKNGLPAGIIMIDDTWQDDYGKWTFDPEKFPNPKKMVKQLHKMGFKVMLWVCPFVSMDQYQICRDIIRREGFLKAKDGEPYPVRWWNGTSAVLDLSSKGGIEWFDEQLTCLVKEHGIDGFKFDAADFVYYPEDAIASSPEVKAWDQCGLFVDFAARYPYNELRAGWKNAGRPIVQRLHDKEHSWTDLYKLIPEMLAEGLMGFSFCCPDMIGGGSFATFLNGKVDQELVVRSAQVHALMPMMQFSLAPWRVLDKRHYKAVLAAVQTRQKMLPLIKELTERAAKCGEPIVAPMEYWYPGNGYENIVDQFCLGSGVIVAPVLTQDKNRTVVLPEGRWISDLGDIYEGGQSIKLYADIERLPYFISK